MVQRNRLEEQAHQPGRACGDHTGPHHRRGVVGPRRGGHHDTGQVADRGDRVVVVEVPAETLLVAVSGDPHHHRVAVLTVGEELQRGTLAADLVGGVVQIGQVLDLRDGQQPADAGAQGQSEDRLLVEQRVENPCRPGCCGQPPGHAVDTALAGDVLAEQQRLGVVGQRLAQRPVDGLRHRDRRPVVPAVCPGCGLSGGPHRIIAGLPQRCHHRVRAVQLR